MSIRKTFHLQASSAAVVSCAALMMVPVASFAATLFKANTTTLVNASDWTDNVAPTTADTCTYTTGSTIALSNSINQTLGGNLSIGNLYTAQLHPIVIKGDGYTLTLNSSSDAASAGTLCAINAGGGGALMTTLNCPITLAANATFRNSAGGLLTLNGAIGESSAGKSLVLMSATSNGQPGSYWLTAANSYSGGTYIGRLATATTTGSGTLVMLSGNATLGASGSALTMNANGVGTVLDLGGTSQTLGAVNFGTWTTVQNGSISGTSFSGHGVIDANLSGPGAYTLNNSGQRLILSGSNNYSGGTTITAGTLLATKPGALPLSGVISLAASANAILAIRAGGTGEWGASDLTSLLTYGSLTVGSAGTLGIDTTGGDSSYSSAIAGPTPANLALTKLGPNTLTLTGASTYQKVTTINRGTLAVDNTAGGSLNSSSPLTFTGTGAFTYNTASTAQSLGALTLSGGEGTIQLTRSGTATLTLASLAARTAGKTANLSFNGTTPGATDGIKFTTAAAGFMNQGIFYNGADYAYMDAANTFVRKPVYGTDANFTAADTITASTHVKLTATPAAQNSVTLNTLNLAGGGVGFTLNGGQTLTLANGGIIKAGGGSAGTISGGAVQTTDGLRDLVVRTDTASDALTISSALGTAAPSRTGTCTINTKIISGISIDTADLYVGMVVQVQTTSSFGANQPWTTITAINSASQITVNHNFGLTTGTYTLVFNGNSLTKSGAGTLTLSGANNLVNVNLNGGRLNIDGNTALGGAPPPAVGGNYGPIGTLTINEGTTIDNTSGAPLTTYRYGIVWNGSFTFVGSSDLLLSSGGSITIPNDITITTSTLDKTLKSGAAVGTTMARLTKRGPGTLQFDANGSQQFMGGLNVYEGVYATSLSFTFWQSLCAAPILLGDPAAGNSRNAIIDCIKVSNHISPITVQAGSSGTLAILAENSPPMANPLVLNNNLTLATPSGTLSYLGLISGTGNLSIGVPSGGLASITVFGVSKSLSNAGTVKLMNENTFTGNTVINSGTLQLYNALSLQNSILDTTTSVANKLTLGAPVTTLTLGGLSGSKNFGVTAGDMFATTSSGYSSVTALTLNPGVGQSPSYSGIIANGASGMTLTKTGAGTQTLSGANTYSGATTISAGTLALDTGGTLASTPNITVASGATFDVSATTLSSALTLGSSQSLTASATGANASGAIRVGSGKDLTLGGTTTALAFNAYGGGATPPLTVAGTAGALNLNGKPVTVTTTTALAAGTYTLVGNAGTGATVSGTPGTLTMNGSGLASGCAATLTVSSGTLVLNVFQPTLTVSGFPGSIAQGAPGTVTVTAKDNSGNTYAGYTGTVHFTCSDGAASLPADYTYTSGDAGTCDFSVTLNTLGTQSITATDTATSQSGTQSGISVSGEDFLSSLVVSGFPTPTTAGAAGSVTVTAKDQNDNVMTSYAGTIHFTSTDGAAVLPGDYTFVAGDSGVHTFAAGVTLKTAGTRSITATDTVAPVSGTQSGIEVNPDTAATLTVSGFPNPVIAGIQGSFTVTARDAYGNTDTNYTGTVTNFSSDAAASFLPDPYTFVPADAGVKGFSATLHTAGTQSITTTNTGTGVGGSQEGIVVTAPSLFFWTNTVSGNWSAAANWTNDLGGSLAPVPCGRTNYTLNFNQAGTYSASNNLNDGFLLNRLNFGGTAKVTLAGNSLALANDGATLPQINQNSSQAVAVNNDLILTTNVTVGGSGAGVLNLVGNISGAGMLTLSGAEKHISGTNTHSGGLVINTSVRAYGAHPYGADGAIHVTVNGSTLWPWNQGYSLGTLVLNGNSTLLSSAGGIPWSGPIILNTNVIFRIELYTSHLPGNISGPGGFTKTLTQSLQLSGTNTYSGPTVFTGGNHLELLKRVSLYNGDTSMWTASNITINGDSGIKLYVGGTGEFTADDAGLLFTRLATVNNDGLRAGSSFGIINSGSVTLATNLTDSVGTGGGLVNFQKNGGGELELTGANTFSGKTTMTAGTLKVSSFNYISSGTLNPNTSSSLGKPTTADNGIIAMGFPNYNWNPTLIYTGSGETTDRGLYLSGGSDAIFSLYQSGSGLLKFTTPFTMFAGNMYLALRGATAGTGEIAATITDPSMTTKLKLNKYDSGSWFLSSANTYSGNTLLNGGALVLMHANALPGGIGVTGGTSALTFWGGGVLGLGAGDFTRSLAAANTVTGVWFRDSGGWAAYGADRAVNLGGASASISWGTADTGFNGKILILGANTATHTVDLQNPIDLGATTRTVQTDNGSALVDGKMSGVLSNGNLSKTGLGTLALAATNTYAGTTAVTAGTLLVNGNNSGSSTFTVSSGATLGGTGRIGGAATFSTGAKAVFTVTRDPVSETNTTPLTVAGVMTYNTTEVHLNLPANLPSGVYTLATSSATPAGSINSTPVVDSGSYAAGFASAVISLDTANKLLLLTVNGLPTYPTQLAITSVNGGVSPTAGVAFNITVQSQDANGLVRRVLADTAVTLSVKTGNGSLGGTVSGTILAGTSSVTISDVTYNAVEAGVVLTATSTSGDTLTAGDSAPFTVLADTVPVALDLAGFPSPQTAGVAGSVTVTAKTGSGATATGYTGTVHFTSSAVLAGLPGDYTFVSGDSGVHVFGGVTLNTAGSQSITATDTVTPALTDTQSGIIVTPAAAATLVVAGFPSPQGTGANGSITVTARDAYGNTDTNYTGTIHFTSSDVLAVLPVDYTFVAGDAGTHTFTDGVTLNTVGTQSITATDTVTGTITGAQSGITVWIPPTDFSWTNAVSGVWSSSGNWTNNMGVVYAPVAAGQSDYTLRFNAGTYNATHDLGNGFLLNQMHFAGTVTIPGTSSITLTNNGAVLPQINQNSASAAFINPPLALTTNVTVGGTGNGTVTMNGVISGAGGLIKSNAGVLWLWANSSYSGGTLLQNGSISCGTTLNSLFGTGAVTLEPGTTLNLNGNAGGIANALVLNGAKVTNGNGFQAVWSGPVSLTGINTIDVLTTGNMTLSGIISGSGGLTKIGTSGGPLKLTATNTFTGTTTINAGSILITASGQLASRQIVVNAGTLSLSNSSSLLETVRLTIADGGGAKIDIPAGVTQTVATLILGSDGMPELSGTWGHSSSDADHEDDVHFTATTGKLRVLEPGTVFRFR